MHLWSIIAFVASTRSFIVSRLLLNFRLYWALKFLLFLNDSNNNQRYYKDFYIKMKSTIEKPAKPFSVIFLL